MICVHDVYIQMLIYSYIVYFSSSSSPLYIYVCFYEFYESMNLLSGGSTMWELHCTVNKWPWKTKNLTWQIIQSYKDSHPGATWVSCSMAHDDNIKDCPLQVLSPELLTIKLHHAHEVICNSMNAIHLNYSSKLYLEVKRKPYTGSHCCVSLGREELSLFPFLNMLDWVTKPVCQKEVNTIQMPRLI